MIMLKLKNADQETKIDFPCLHEHIRYRLEEIGLDGANAPKVLVREVEAPRALSFLEGLEVNVDEINYLANEIESLPHTPFPFLRICAQTSPPFHSPVSMTTLGYFSRCTTSPRDRPLPRLLNALTSLARLRPSDISDPLPGITPAFGVGLSFDPGSDTPYLPMPWKGFRIGLFGRGSLPYVSKTQRCTTWSPTDISLGQTWLA